MAVLREAHRHHPEDLWLNDVLGWLSMDAFHPPRFDEALRYYAVALALRPRNAHAHGAVAAVLEKKGALEEAIAEYARALELDPKNAVIWSNRGVAYTELGEYEKAIADLSKAIELEPKDPVFWTNRGYAYNKLHQYEKALADLNKGIEFEPKNARAWSNLAWLLATCPDTKVRAPSRAVELAKKAVDLGPKEGVIWNTLGVAHFRAGNWQAAIEALDKSRELRQGGNSFDWFFLAMAHWQLKHNEEARRWYHQAVQWMEKNNPKDEELRRFGAEAEQLLGINQKQDKKNKKR
jgi:tetratricopeptide (TPR) repeat protein